MWNLTDAPGRRRRDPREWKEVFDMSTVSAQAPPTAAERPRWFSRVLVREMWASLAITAMWLAVLFCSIFGPDFVAISGAGASTTTIPSGIIVAFFAYLGTRVVARYGLSGPPDAD
jgi:hypothetical protein